MTLHLNNLLKRILPDWIYDKLIGRWNSDGLKRYTANTLWALVARITSLVVSFFVSIYLVRYLGPENYGQLSYAISFVGLFSIISNVGIDNILYRDLIKYPSERNAYLGSAFIIKFAAGALASLATIISVYLLSTSDVSRLVIVLLSATFLFNAFNVIGYQFQADVAQKYTSIIALFAVFTLNLLKLLVIWMDEGILYIGVIFLIESILYAVLFLAAYLWRYGSLLNWRFSRRISLSLLRDSWPFIFIAAFTTIYARIDQVMLKHMMDASAVGLYDAAVRLAEIWLFVPALIASSLFPAIVNARENNPIEYKKRLVLLTGLLAIFGLLVAIPATILAEEMTLFLYGSAFIASAGVLSIYVWASVFASIDIVVRYFLIAENRRTLIFIISMGTALVNVGLNLFLIPKYGIIGAAWATLISYVLLTVPFLLILKLKVKAPKINEVQ